MIVHKERPCHESNYRKGRKQEVRYLVIHYVGALGGAAANAYYYGTTPDIEASAHYFVGHAPTPEIWSSVAEWDTAWHVGAKKYVHPDCRNENSIGVELCCHRSPGGTWYFDEETMSAAVELCREIVERYGIPKERMLRHYDVTGKICPAPFVQDSGLWEEFRARVFAPKVNPAPLPMTFVADWAKDAWLRAKESQVLDGTRATDPVTRQELAVVLDRLGLLKGGGV